MCTYFLSSVHTDVSSSHVQTFQLNTIHYLAHSLPIGQGVKGCLVFFLNGVGVTKFDVYEHVFFKVTSITLVSNCGLSAVNNATLLIDLANNRVN